MYKSVMRIAVAVLSAPVIIWSRISFSVAASLRPWRMKLPIMSAHFSALGSKRARITFFAAPMRAPTPRVSLADGAARVCTTLLSVRVLIQGWLQLSSSIGMTARNVARRLYMSSLRCRQPNG